MNITLILMAAALAICPCQTSNASDKALCEERAQQVLKTLEPDNDLRYSVERGQRGDCIHYPWMDSMKRLGIKQASFSIEYSWKHDKVNFKIKGIYYLEHYYSGYGKSIDGKRLREIQRSGLERELSEAVLARLRNSRWAVREPGTISRDSFTANVLDDEALPILDVIY